MPFLDRSIRKIMNTKQESMEYTGIPSLGSMLEGQTAIHKKSNTLLAIYRKKFGKLWKVYMSSNGNQVVDKNLNVFGRTKSKITVSDLIFEKGEELTISSGVITVTHSYHQIDTESDASSDNLNTINGGADGQILILRTSSNSRDVIVKNDDGNILISDGDDHTLGTANSVIVLFKNGNNWYELITKGHQ
tara:strand:- start:8633 stop:9202 length:570 start_codon:yes stop_codon:yes gene_type:complete